ADEAARVHHRSRRRSRGVAARGARAAWEANIGRLTMIMNRAAFTLLALAAFAAIDARPTYAEIYRPWCAVYQGSRRGATTFGFTSFQQCMMTAGPGTGASCVQNPWYLAYGTGQIADPPVRGKRRIRREQTHGCRLTALDRSCSPSGPSARVARAPVRRE